MSRLYDGRSTKFKQKRKNLVLRNINFTDVSGSILPQLLMDWKNTFSLYFYFYLYLNEEL